MAQLAKKGGAVGALCSVAAIIAIVLGNGNVRTNERGLELIGNAEGCRREPYVCPAAKLTDGVGNTHGVKAGVRKTDVQIAADWERNILEAERCVNSYGNGRKLSDNTFSAVTSITFNAGCGAMQKSTMFQLLRQGQVLQACDQFSRWVYGGGKVLPGLVTRRGAEKQLCLDGV
ncbi:lysozyme [Escherichia coli]|uniref:lysozyme n=1 Tax=Escherichia coli TaxID=562 RepID=UPI0009ACAA22|nr:lysozyme [Escherichia coli]HDQ6461799.1 lysozyme [Escherichia coli O18 str. F10018-41]ARA15845.1 glycoside hydrolase [Escherichia coli]EEW2177001.1 lysozyme [Escherichia coli]EFJ3041015.1 lysozyme [Escherichia coli]EFL5744571.1 lysozyme [Escherichia coli]